jgi:hypothetical protein
MKSYRTRGLTQKCQIAKTEDGVTPLRDDRNNVILDHGGQWFLTVSGGTNHENKRLIPVDHVEFFKLKAREFEDALKAEGITDVTVTIEMIYEEFVATFTKPNGTYAPPGHPEEFSIVLSKNLCVNWRGCVGGSNGTRPMATVAPQESSLFARIRASRLQAAANQTPAPKKKPS